MSDDFCIIHGTEFMRSKMGNPVSYCDACENAREAPKPPYPFCRTPEKCAGKGYCPADIACND